MKLISAIIREQKLDEVRQSLIDAGISRITVHRVSGHGQQVKEQVHRGQIVVPGLIPKIKLEVAVNDEYVDTTVNAILKSAKSSDNGEVGDGKIFITALEECIRIRTEEKGNSAI